MANFNVELNRFNGTNHDALLVRNTVEGTTNPTTSTIGFIGQLYVNTATKQVWQCFNNAGGVYTWEEMYSPNEILSGATKGLYGLGVGATPDDVFSLATKFDLSKKRTFVFDTSASWSAPPNIIGNKVLMVCCGGGGAAPAANKGGGGGSGYVNVAEVAVTPGTTYNIVIGAGGKDGVNSGTGGATTFSAWGGSSAGGTAGTVASTTNGGNGGNGNAGGGGSDGMSGANFSYPAGNGGDGSIYGGGGGGGAGSTGGIGGNGGTYGGGGGGARNGPGVLSAGGTGGTYGGDGSPAGTYYPPPSGSNGSIFQKSTVDFFPYIITNLRGLGSPGCIPYGGAGGGYGGNGSTYGNGGGGYGGNGGDNLLESMNIDAPNYHGSGGGGYGGNGGFSVSGGGGGGGLFADAYNDTTGPSLSQFKWAPLGGVGGTSYRNQGQGGPGRCIITYYEV